MLAALALAPEKALLLWLYASLRCGTALAFLPALGGQLIPVRVRVGLSGAFALLVLGNVDAPTPPADLLSVAGMAQVFGEILIGGVAALALHTAFAAAIVAGEWLAQTMGLGFATMVAPGTGPQPVLGGIFVLLCWAMFLTGGGHLLLLRLLADSYHALPTAALLFEPARLAAVAGWGGLAFLSGLMMALPVGVALLMINLALAVASRSAPQLNLFSVGFPVMMLVGLAALPLAFPLLADGLSGMLVTMQEQAAEVLLGR